MSGNVFCVGFHKTGTKSLKKALTLLGYRVAGPNGVNDPGIAERAYAIALQVIEGYCHVEHSAAARMERTVCNRPTTGRQVEPWVLESVISGLNDRVMIGCHSSLSLNF